ncbi:hypothetical protein [Sphingobacterium multivorum]|uniref:hypothetical protein n=1 Tax=Sphingobacterium multivorum TaxID=28454 RepID=UPI003DA2E82D
MIKNLYFETTNTLFSRAQALVWVANGLSFLDLFEKSSGNLLSKIIEDCPPEKSLLINFKGIIRFDDHCLDEVFNTLEGNKKQIVIINGEHLISEFIKLKKEKQVNINHDTTNKVIIIGDSRPIDVSDLFEEREKSIQKYINTILKSTFTKFGSFKRLCSTPFLANGEFDSKKIIESPKDFMWISFYLSDKLFHVIESEKLTNVILVSASLRGAAFTSILGILNDLEFVNIDHIGPIHKIYDLDYFDVSRRNCNYLYVGDFVFGGTEIKLTKMYASFSGGKLDHALVLGSLFDSEVFTDFRLHELNTLKEITTEAKFKLFD